MDKKDVFISYKTEEFEEAEWVRSTLENNGITCWMAPSCIPGGSSYAVEIPQAIRNCKVFVLILSEKSQLSKWVPRELDQAINEGKTVLPFMLENCALKDDFNFYLTNVQRYAAYESKTAAIEKMLREIKALLASYNPPDSDKTSDPVEETNVAQEEDKLDYTPEVNINNVNNDQNLQEQQHKPEKVRREPKAKKPSRVKKTENINKSKKKLFVFAGATAAFMLIIAISVIVSVLNTVEIAGQKYKKSDLSVFVVDCEITVDDIEAIKKMDDLNSINFENCTLPGTDISWVACTGDYLVLKNCGLTDEHIASIDFSSLSVADLNFDNNPLITDLSAVSELSETLRTLSFNGCSVQDVSFLSSLSNLNSLYADQNAINDISSLSGLTDLQFLSLNSNHISSLEALSDCSQLIKVCVNSNSLTSLNGLQKAISLATLEAANNSISNLDGIKNATVLERVVLNNINLPFVSIFSDPLGILAKSALTLKELYLDSCHISDFSALSVCTKLHTLSINYNRYLSSLNFLENCTDISYLSFSGCAINSLDGIRNCTKLTYLDLSKNAITSADNLPAIEFDETGVHLDLSDNSISAVNLPKINYIYLDLHNNQISTLDLSGISGYEFIFDYSDTYDFSAVKAAGFSKHFVIDCPLDKQLSVTDALGDYGVSFMNEDEYDSYLRTEVK